MFQKQVIQSPLERIQESAIPVEAPIAPIRIEGTAINKHPKAAM